MPKAVSRRQARFFGAVAGGAIKRKGLSIEEAAKRIEGISMKKLPERARRKKKR